MFPAEIPADSVQQDKAQNELTFAGKRGLADVAETCSARAHELAMRLVAEADVQLPHAKHPFFHEFVVRLPVAAVDFTAAMRDRHDIVAGLPLSRFDATRPNDLLVCATEQNADEDIDAYVAAAKAVLAGATARA